MFDAGMASFLLLVGALGLGVFAYFSWKRFRDPLHPVIFMGPLFFVGMVAEPAMSLRNPAILEFFPDYTGLDYAITVQLLGILALFLGLMSVKTTRLRIGVGQSLDEKFLSPFQRTQLRSFAWLMASIVVCAFWFNIYTTGGFARAYGQAKGGATAASGYLGEMNNLGIAALVIFSLGSQRRPITLGYFVSALIMISPVLIHGTFGGRRGPLFLACLSLFIGYWIARGRVPKFWQSITVPALIVLAVIFVGSQRRHLYLGSGNEIRWEEFFDSVTQQETGAGDNFVVSSGAVIAVSQLDAFHWGRRFLITYVIRPIPRQIWPSKYDDVSDWLYGTSFEQVQTSHYEWFEVLNWRPLNGFATNSVVDLFMEFSWGYLPALWLFGRGLGVVWKNFRERGGYWFVVYVTVGALSIYLPTQSFSAFAHRFLYMTLMTYFFWRFYIGKTGLRGDPALAMVRKVSPVNVKARIR